MTTRIPSPRRRPILLPDPDCTMGYTMKQVKEMFGVIGFEMLLRFMDGQTMSHCSCKRYDHESNQYVDSSCRHEASTIFYTDDIRRFANRLPVVD
jgi:hypothetical protein